MHLALLKLYARSIYSTLTGGPASKSLSLWGDDGAGSGSAADDKWTIAAVKEGFRKRWADRLGADDDGQGGGEGREAGGDGQVDGRADRWDADGEPNYDDGDWIGLGQDTGGDDDEIDSWTEVSGCLLPRVFLIPGADCIWIVQTALLIVLCLLVAVFSWIRKCVFPVSSRDPLPTDH